MEETVRLSRVRAHTIKEQEPMKTQRTRPSFRSERLRKHRTEQMVEAVADIRQWRRDHLKLHKSPRDLKKKVEERLDIFHSRVPPLNTSKETTASITSSENEPPGSPRRKAHTGDWRPRLSEKGKGMEIQRLIEPKAIRQKGEVVYPEIELGRQQQMSAIAALLTVEATNTTPCNQCVHVKSRGPCKECVAGPPTLFSGACTNCQYSSTASHCSFYKPNKRGKKRARTAESEERESSGGFVLDRETLDALTTAELEEYKTMIIKEINRRRLARIPTSRTRM
ncbi:uncharacterized protein F4812DRAFT_457423 [Daldinia caldariorum]|uniref:uncharacterized protein n=1 Tax=Daldinia caldariorum TaxID=326644 RepID=UPI002008E429|nr:uncharacterized protein F4812DRAFT_457423 [Daldinia caldariorum]KAI1470025.1 hypothetical protein F4812DRAFT_457423 [Daldinia caldariorum]